MMDLPISNPKYVFHLTYFSLGLASLASWNGSPSVRRFHDFSPFQVIDVFCYARIFNYMRKHSVRVTVVPVTASERSKVRNVVTAPSSLLVWLVSSVSMLPPSLLLLRQPVKDDVIALVNYQILTLFVMGTVASVMYMVRRGRMDAN